MSFRFRKSIGFGFGRINLSKSGASLSLGAPGNVVNFGRRGVRHTAGIPGTGMSWSHKIGGGRQAPSYSNDDIGDALTKFYDNSEMCEAGLEVAEAEYHEMDVLVSNAENLLARTIDPKEEDVAKVATMRAIRHRKRVELDQMHRQLKRGRAKVRNIQAWRITKAILMFAVFIWIWSAWKRVDDAPAHAAHQVQSQVSKPTSSGAGPLTEEKEHTRRVFNPPNVQPALEREEIPTPRPRPRLSVQQ